MDRNDAMRKIQALLKQASSTHSLDESQTATAIAEKLMERHRVTEATLELNGTAKHRIEDELILNFATRGAPLEEKGGQRWRCYLASKLAGLFACATYTHRTYDRDTHRERAQIHIIGRPSDVDSMRYMYGFLAHEINRLCDLKGRGCGRTWRNNFRIGAVEGVAEKMRRARDEARRELRREASDTSALMRVDAAVARIDARRGDVDEWERREMRYSGGSAWHVTPDRAARRAGQLAGQQIQTGATGALGTGSKRLPG